MRARHHLDGDGIASLDELLRDVPLRKVVRAPPTADVLTVEPNLVAKEDSVEAEDDALPFPRRIPAEAPNIEAAHLINLIAVLRRLEPLRLPIPRNGDVIPFPRVVSGFVPTLQAIGRIESLYEFERPRAVQRGREKPLPFRVDFPRPLVVCGRQIGSTGRLRLAGIVIHACVPPPFRGSGRGYDDSNGEKSNFHAG